MWSILVLALAPAFQESPAQTSPAQASTAQAVPDRPSLPDAVAAQVDPAHLRDLIEQLAMFGTRHTLSETESDERGIGAARRWILSEFDSYEGGLEADLDPHEVTARGGQRAAPLP